MAHQLLGLLLLQAMALPPTTMRSEHPIYAATQDFLATLTPAQVGKAKLPLTKESAAKWSNLPGGVQIRNGVQFSDLNEPQLAAALKLARTVLGSKGFDRFQSIRAADGVLEKIRPGSYSSNQYIVAILGEPSRTEPWMIQLGGHHIAANITIKGETGWSSPYFLGLEPESFESDGKTITPIANVRAAITGLAKSLTPDQVTKSMLKDSFGDVVVGPGNDGKFPARQGVPVTALSPESQAWVKKAIIAYTGDSPFADAYQKRYFAELSETRVAISGTTAQSKPGDYVRIDGPSVWIEFICQPGANFPDKVHFHSVWRDRKADYGGFFTAARD